MLLPLYSALGPLGRKYGGGLWSGWAGLQHYWKLDETTGVRYDAVGAAHLTDNNTVGYAAGVHNNAASFVGANSESLSRTGDVWPHPSTGSSTVAFWMKSTLSGTTGVMGQYAGAADGILLFEMGVTLQFLAYSSAGQEYAAVGVVGDGAWHLVVATYDADTGVGTCYIDNGAGVVSFTKAAASFGSSWAADFVIGYFPGGGYYDGLVDEPAIWSRVLTADERTELYNAGAGRFYPS